MENNTVCTICNRSFCSGKALGGHMKSHLVKFPISPKPATNNQVPENLVESMKNPIHPLSTSSSLTVQPRPNPIHNLRSLKRVSFSLLNSGIKEKFEFYPKNPTRKRSKRHRKFFAVPETKVERRRRTLTADIFYVEEAAWTLTMLSKDKWPKNKEIETQEVEEKANVEEAKIAQTEDDSPIQTQLKTNFKCEICQKFFQSYEIFVGHKENHEKNENPCEENDGSGLNSDVVDQKVHECPYCSKMFESDQALEEHKKVHIFDSMVANTQNIANESGENFFRS